MLTAEHYLVYAEPLLTLAVLVIFVRAGFARRFPAMRNYLGMRVGSTFALEAILNLQYVVPVAATTQYYIYFYTYWISFLISAVLIFFVLKEIYSELMRPVPGLRGLGMMAFRWVVAISGIIAIAIAFGVGFGSLKTLGDRLVYTALLAVHSVSVLELCLLAFLALTIHNLGRSFRSPLFGIGLGLGIQAATDFMLNSLVKWQHGAIWSTANLCVEASVYVVLLTWGTYFLLPEPVEERSVQVVPSPSPLIRWNDVAQALGHSSPRVAAGASTGFFLQDVERVVDRVLARNQVPEADTPTKVG